MVYRNVPGVFIEELKLLPPSVAGVATGIPAFIGYTQKAETAKGVPLKLVPTRISSLNDYVSMFGTAQPENDLEVAITQHITKDGKVVLQQTIDVQFAAAGGPSVHNMYYAVQLYFANGGGPCYIVSVNTFNGAIAKADLAKGLAALESEDEPTMIVFPEAMNLEAIADYFGIYNDALMQAADLKDRFVIIDVLQTDLGINNDINTVFRKEAGGLMADNAKFGAAYYPYLQSTIDYYYADQDEALIKVTFKKIKPDNTEEISATLVTLAALKGPENLLYNLAKDKIGQVLITLPSSPAMAGVYARVDSDRGVWKAPANVGVAGIAGPSIKVTDAEQDYMNIHTSGKSVNAIRSITGRGTVVWGARTLDGNDNEWRYISVRRFFNFVEESVKKATYPFVFEPNDANTWVRVRAMIENFLTLQWRAGALQGVKPEQAFFVRVGLGQTMTAIDIYEGRMIVEIGMAVVRPAEFIILRFSHKMVES